MGLASCLLEGLRPKRVGVQVPLGWTLRRLWAFCIPQTWKLWRHRGTDSKAGVLEVSVCKWLDVGAKAGSQGIFPRLQVRGHLLSMVFHSLSGNSQAGSRFWVPGLAASSLAQQWGPAPQTFPHYNSELHTTEGFEGPDSMSLLRKGSPGNEGPRASGEGP